jgi:BirA family biotin operon repressor/biotin-[acetyl-CoA-carboxylase] ligase
MKLKTIKFNNVRSTNDKAIELIRKKKTNPSIIIAKKQIKGRGTGGKKWISIKNNLFISIFFEISSSNIQFDQFAFLNPYIIRKVLKKYTKNKIFIKWPNDLLLKKKKLSGILQEIIDFEKKKYLIIGIGINTMDHPKSPEFKATSLAKWSNRAIINGQILKDIKIAYEKFISDISKHKITYLRRKICRG